MKILFICGSLEEGKDGVGDYVRSLSRELVSQGHEVSALALFDRFIAEDWKGEMKIGTGQFLEVLRISASRSYLTDFYRVKNWVEAKHPDWISLQFVPFSFQNKGLPLRLGRTLKSIKGDFKWHLMFHEPWMAPHPHSTFKQRLLALAQRLIIQGTVKRLQPSTVNTSNPHYQNILAEAGISSTVLPLPSNISLSELALEEMKKEFATLGLSEELRASWCVIGVFGRLRANVDFIPLIKKMKAETQSKNKRLAFFSMGKSGAEAQRILKKIALEFKEGLFVHQFGERSPEEVSAYLQLLDYGVSTVLKPFLGKSGAVSAMRLHGLTVLVPDPLNGLGPNDDHHEINGRNADFSARHIAWQFIHQLEAYNRNTNHLMN